MDIPADLKNRYNEFQLITQSVLTKAGLPSAEPIVGRRFHFFYLDDKHDPYEIISTVESVIIDVMDIVVEFNLSEDSRGRAINSIEFIQKQNSWHILVERRNEDEEGDEEEETDSDFHCFDGIFTLEPIPRTAIQTLAAPAPQPIPITQPQGFSVGSVWRFEQVPDNVVFLLRGSSSSFSTEHFQRLSDLVIQRVEFRDNQWSPSGFGQKTISPKDLVEIVEVF